jgi:hypothetical protein
MLMIVALVCAQPESAWATTGISALGAVLDVLLLGIAALGLVLLIFICVAIVDRAPDRGDPPSGILIGIGYGYLLGALLLYYQGEPGPICLVLGLVVVLIAVALAVLQASSGTARALTVVGVLVAFVILTGLRPHALAFHERVHVDNAEELQGQGFERPMYWRVMATADGRRFLDLRTYVRNNRKFDDGRKPFSAPLVFTRVDREGSENLHRVNEIQRTTGAWGWSGRDEAVVTVPIFGRAKVPRYELKPVGRALLLDRTVKVEGRYLFEAVSERKGDRAPRVDLWIRELIDLRTDPNYVDPESDESVLMRALRLQPLGTVEYLVANGSDVNYVNPRTGVSALQVAAKRSRGHMELLVAAGAKAGGGG